MKIHKGFSLVEVLIFTGVLSLFFVAAMSVATYNLKAMKIQEHKILATRFAEEGVEWAKEEKESDWSTFINYDTAGTGTTYCLNSLDWNIASSCGDSYTLGTPAFYKRELLITNSALPVDQVNITVTVNWKEGSNNFNVSLKNIFKLLE